MTPNHPRILEQTSCPFEGCGSSDAFTITQWPDGNTTGKCFSCNRSSPCTPTGMIDTLKENKSNTGRPQQSITSLEECLDHPVRSLGSRGISYSTANYFSVRVGVSTTDGETPIYHLYPRHDNGNLRGFQKRTVLEKTFTSIGDCSNCDLVGLHLIPDKGKKVWITEGDLDMMSLFQALKENSTLPNYNPPVVSLPNGCASAAKSITKNLDKLNGFDEIILCFDNDEPGKKATDEICKILAGKVSVLRLQDYKDANEMLMAGKSNELKWLALTHAKKYHPDGIINAKDTWDRYKNSKNAPRYAYPPSMPGLQEHLQGCGDGSLIMVTSGSGCGKTQFTRELEYWFYISTQEKIASIKLEEDVGDTVSGLISLHLNKRIQLPTTEVTDDEEQQAFKYLFESGRFSLYDFFGGMDDSTLFSKLRYFAATGHKFIFLDHLSIIISEYATQGSERERIDQLMTKLARFVKETGTILFLVCHLRKTDSNQETFEQGAAPTLDSLRGSGALKQLSWDVIGLSRNQQHLDSFCANTTEVISLKCRFTGRTGVCDYLNFDEKTGRMVNVPKPENYRPVKRGLK